MNDAFRYVRVFTIMGLMVAATVIGMRSVVGWTFAAKPDVWSTDDRHLRLSVKESQTAEYDKQPYKGGKLQTQYEKL